MEGVGIVLVGGGGQSGFMQLVGSWARAVGVRMVNGRLGFEGPWEAPCHFRVGAC
jgi:hypothetical protein